MSSWPLLPVVKPSRMLSTNCGLLPRPLRASGACPPKSGPTKAKPRAARHDNGVPRVGHLPRWSREFVREPRWENVHAAAGSQALMVFSGDEIRRFVQRMEGTLGAPCTTRRSIRLIGPAVTAALLRTITSFTITRRIVSAPATVTHKRGPNSRTHSSVWGYRPSREAGELRRAGVTTPVNTELMRVVSCPQCACSRPAAHTTRWAMAAEPTPDRLSVQIRPAPQRRDRWVRNWRLPAHPGNLSVNLS